MYSRVYNVIKNFTFSSFIPVKIGFDSNCHITSLYSVLFIIIILPHLKCPRKFFLCTSRACHIRSYHKFLKINCSAVIHVKYTEYLIDKRGRVSTWKNLIAYIYDCLFGKLTCWTVVLKSPIPFSVKIN